MFFFNVCQVLSEFRTIYCLNTLNVPPPPRPTPNNYLFFPPTYQLFLHYYTNLIFFARKKAQKNDQLMRDMATGYATQEDYCYP